MQHREENELDKYEELLVRKIQQSVDSNNVIKTTLKTDERVIARVTDGIYRQPGSALRELISNSYDADATRVVIKTDAPRFDRISIEDDGIGMSPQALAHMLLHIGGSAKRQEIGHELGITSESNSTCSPSGRKLIGKIGIGIFSVAQLTHTFQIITKTKGDNFRTIATVALKQYSDIGNTNSKGQKETYESGKVNIWREKAKDISAHGTTIILTDIRPQARDTLRSNEIWSVIEQNEQVGLEDEKQTIEPPKFHIGRVDKTGKILKKTKGFLSNLPWDSEDKPDKAFKKLVQCVWDEFKFSNPNPQLDKIFDYYLQMVWQVSLAIPIEYVEGHLFDEDLFEWAESFQISNEPKASAKILSIKKNIPIRKTLNLIEPIKSENFEVYFDDLKLQIPIKYKKLPTGDHALKKPLVFIGKCKEEFKSYPAELSGGVLEFEAYLFWNPKIAPSEHRGSLIRINGASGTLFDPSFMRYQVSEQTRLRQITCEIFVHKGFESSLNIDRESFNYAHPHAVYLTRWLYSALRQVATTQKKVAAEIRGESRSKEKTENFNAIQKIAIDVWQEMNDDEDSNPPSISIENESIQQKLIKRADIVLNRFAITSKKGEKQNLKPKVAIPILDEKIKAIAQVLASFGLLEKLTKRKQEQLLNAIYQILETPE